MSEDGLVRRYLFILRGYNDVDHLTPLIDRICQSSEHDAFLITISRYLLHCKNENLEYLNEKYQKTPAYFLDGLIFPWPIRFLDWVYILLIKTTDHITLAPILRRLLNYILAALKFPVQRFEKKYSREIINGLLDRVRPNILIFDMTYSSIYPNNHLIAAAKERKILSVALPHGLTVWTNFDHSIRTSNPGLSLDGFAYGISQGDLASHHLKAEGWPENRIVEIGSMRFSSHWLARCADVYKAKTIQPENLPTIKVAFFLSKAKYRASIKNTKDLIRALLAISDVRLILKPHTRGMKMDSFREFGNEKNFEVAYETSSFELSQWCDIAFVYGSSIGLQVLADKKLLVYPASLDANSSIYQLYGAANVISNHEEVARILEDYRSLPESAFWYTEKEVTDLFRAVVYAGEEDCDVIQKQLQFLDSLN